MLPAGTVAVIIIAGTVMTRAGANASPLDTYRTTTVTIGSVEQRLNLTGSVQRVNQVSQSFPVTGTVSSVSVSVGDTVTAGQVLATLAPAPLRSAVISAQATLAGAKATLESDQSSATAATSNANTTTAASSAGATSGTADTTASTPVTAAKAATTTRAASPSRRSGAGTSVAGAQQRVTSAQRAITADLQRAASALAQCGPVVSALTASASLPSMPSPPTTPTPSATTTPSGGHTPRADPTPTGAPTPKSTTKPTTTATTPSQAAIKACVGALRIAPTLKQIQGDKKALTESQTALMKNVTLAITTASKAAKTPATTSHSAKTGQSSSGRSSNSQVSGGQAGGAGQSNASRVVSDQAAVTKAEAALSSAQADLTAATLKSSRAGTVGSVSLVNGESSQGKSVVVVGAGAVEVTVEVPLASITQMHVGQKANVTPQGATSSVPGAVTSISLLPATSTGSTGTGQGSGSAQATSTTSSPSYPVVVLVPDSLPALASGSRADVSLLIGTASKVLTVPNSALTPLSAGQAVALTLKNGVATRALVKTGYAGTLTTQITSGLTAGQHVVLADLSTALPTNTTGSRRFGVGGGATGGLGGAGLGGGTLNGGAGFRVRG